MKNYDHRKIESKWQREWENKKIYQAKDFSKKPKFFSLIEFPYPSGDGLHVGHPRPYIGMDVISRKRRMEGYNVLYPIGWDAFGLPTENYAIKTGLDPRVVTKKNSDTFRRQIKSLGISFDWSREINTTDPKYYKWTQWIFLQFFKKGLAYKKKMVINWCPKDKIGLANEEVVNGRCERCGTVVEKREKEQWMLAITKYADRLDKDLDTVDYLPQIKLAQRNWIGRSEGAEIEFPVLNPRVKRFIILHGRNGSSKLNFLPWLKKSLEEKGYEVFTPDLPNTGNPNDDEQADYLQKNFTFDTGTVIVGHSFGGLVAMRLLERGIKVHGVVFVSTPVTGRFLDNKVRPSVIEAINKGFDYAKIKNQADYFKVLFDSTDSVVPSEDGQILAKNLGAYCRVVSGSEPHFCGQEEPEILSVLLPNIKIFTTRPDTIFGATYLVLAPENPYVQSRMGISENKTEIKNYLTEAKKKDETVRLAVDKEKTGVELKGLKVINPATKEEIPVWIADYVLPQYGTGAIMAVPAHDERDFEFAKKYNLPVRQVIAPHLVDKNNPPQVGKRYAPRVAVQGVVKHWIKDEFIQIKWKGFPWNTFVIGGAEEGEDLKVAVKREVQEETGYKNIKSVIQITPETRSEWYADHKDENRYAHMNIFLVELGGPERDEITEEEKSKHEVAWVPRSSIPTFSPVGEIDYIVAGLNNADLVYTGDGIIINSGEFSEKQNKDALGQILKFVGGKEKTTFKLRDCVFSIQIYL